MLMSRYGGLELLRRRRAATLTNSAGLVYAAAKESWAPEGFPCLKEVTQELPCRSTPLGLPFRIARLTGLFRV